MLTSTSSLILLCMRLDERRKTSQNVKIDDLLLSDAEWELIGLFNDLLVVSCYIFG